MEGGKGTRGEMWREELTGGGQREVGKRGRRGTSLLLGLANFFFGPTFDLENFPTSGVKGQFLLEATPPVGHLLLQLRSSTLESHKATTRTALLNR